MSQSKYKQILSELKKQLLEAKFNASNPFPSEAAVAREKNTTRNTVHRAFIELRRLGLIEGEPGVAPRVAAGKVSRKIGLIVPGVAYSEFFQPIVGEISRLSQERGYTLLFGNITSKDPAKRAAQAKRFAKEERIAPLLRQTRNLADNRLEELRIGDAGDDQPDLPRHLARSHPRRDARLALDEPEAAEFDEGAVNGIARRLLLAGDRRLAGKGIRRIEPAPKNLLLEFRENLLVFRLRHAFPAILCQL